MKNFDLTLFDMEEDLYDLSEYTLNLNFDAHYDRKVMEIYHEFNEEYKNIVKERHNHTCNSIQETFLTQALSKESPKARKDEALDSVEKSFKKKDQYLVRLCNRKFEWLLEHKVFIKK